MLAFLTKNICPKLESALASLVISPRAQVSSDWSPVSFSPPIGQDMAPWTAVMDWADLVPPPQMAQMLAQAFFPRWLQVLAGCTVLYCTVLYCTVL